METFLQQLPFKLDVFQEEAIEVLSQGHSVVVCAPTGSGKTIIAEYAVCKALERGVKLFYTTPLKALSNQKFQDLRRQYGEQNVGLLTGDLSINRDAWIVVMTTEIFRNMLYGLSEDSTLLGNVGYVVLDECHYMNDAERGTVWEESMIYCPETIQLIALSATVANAAELTNWINEVHHDTRLVWSDFRPVPLRHFYFNREELLPLLEGGNQLNKKLKFEMKGNRFNRKNKKFEPNKLILEMHQRNMLPAIFFTFNRKGCDENLKETRFLKLLTDAEREILRRQIDDFVVQHPFLKNNPMLSWIANGFASHHAGQLPGMKLLVENLFQQGLIKAVFATETLAAGINMPARSTVITAISKRTNDGHRLLTASEFLQMSGRAGRRGMDEVGYVITVASPWEGAREAATLATSPANPLESQFTPTYGMVLNLLQRHTLEESRFLISKSFGQFTAEQRLWPMREEIKEKEARVKSLKDFMCPAAVSDEDFKRFVRDYDEMVDAKKFIKVLRNQGKRYGDSSAIRDELSKTHEKVTALTTSLDKSPCNTCDILNRHRRAGEQLKKNEKKLKVLTAQYQDEQDWYWRQFMNLYNLLKEMGYLDESDKPTPKGFLASQIRTENELFMTEILTKGLLDGLNPEQLAGVMCALVNDSTRETQWSRAEASPQSRTVMGEINRELRRMMRIQQKHYVTTPLNLNPLASGLVESWAQGLPWDRLFTQTNLDQGDLVRMLRRTLDLLRQLSRIPEIPAELGHTAKAAIKMVSRDPVKEVDFPTPEETAAQEPAPEEETP